MYTVTANWPSQSRLSYPLYLQGSSLTTEALLTNLVVLDMPLCLVLWCCSKIGLKVQLALSYHKMDPGEPNYSKIGLL